MFDVFMKDLNEHGGGVRAYDAVVRAARARIAGEPDNAAALLLISYAAQHFVDAYDDQPLPADAAAEEFQLFSTMISSLDKAFAGGATGEEKLAALNAAAAQLVTPRT